MKNKIKNFLRSVYRFFFYSSFRKELYKTKRKSSGSINIYGKPFYYHHGLAFHITYEELFLRGIYDFNTTSKIPVILDCGSNMGLSILLFSKKNPNAEIIAFEPDKTVLSFLEKNIISQNLNNVKLIPKGVWSSETNLEFFTDSGMGGRLGMQYQDQVPELVQTVRLRDYLERPIAFLKMDIEGAEYEVLKDIEDRLYNVENIFLEYHSVIDDEQHLEEILDIFKRNSFRYHLTQSFSRRKPFVDKILVCEKYDMAINVFAYKN